MEQPVVSSLYHSHQHNHLVSTRRRVRTLTITVTFVTLLPILTSQPLAAQATLQAIQERGQLTYGCDMEGGGPFAYLDPADPSRLIGFEVEMMQELGNRLGLNAQLSQGQWDQLLQVLSAGRVDMVVNGYELTSARARDYQPTRPYYLFQVQLMVHKEGSIRSWDDLKRPKPDGTRWKIGVLGSSSAETFARELTQGTAEVRLYSGSTEAMLQVQTGQIDATIQDLPAARFYITQFPSLISVDEPQDLGYYVIYVRKSDSELADALNMAINSMISDGTLERIYRKYEIWTSAQQRLGTLDSDAIIEEVSMQLRESHRGWALINRYRPFLLQAAGTTLLLSVSAMPIAILVGLLIALGRTYGPLLIRIPLTAYVEIIRGTPLMLQLFALFYLVKLPNPFLAGIIGLAVNYSAYEAEIYRAGLQAIPKGQLEAGLALGMPKAMAIRRIVIPQAIRIVIPPVTNDFIALFKDSSVCSVITIVELTKQYQILANSTGGVLEFALACAVLYLLMSLPLAWFSRWSERRLRGSQGSRMRSEGGKVQ